MNFYNEIDPFACHWLRRLIRAGHLPQGPVISTPIERLPRVQASTAHFFAGIGGWPLALKLAGWPQDRPVWTGSCPCQPFSVAGKHGGTADPRHLWPEWFRLVKQHKPTVLFGEQVASKAALAWLAGIRADLEGLGYAVGAADLPVASVGAPHIRQRLWWVASMGLEHAAGDGRLPRRPNQAGGALSHDAARMGSGGALNPELSRWLMGYPKEWASCVDMETP